MAPAFSHPYLDLARMEMLRKVRLRPRGLAEGSFAGPHASCYRGTAVEFADYREYTPGDDIRLLDWKVLGRTDRRYIRLYEAERNLLSHLIVDTSGSMAYGGTAVLTPPKLEFACRLACAVGYLAVAAGDEISLALAAQTVHEYRPARSGWMHLAELVETLGRARAAGRTELGSCLQEAYRRAGRRGVLVVFSDFLDADDRFWTAVDLFRRSQFDVMLFHIVHPEELELPDVPLARWTETEGDGAFTAEPEVVRADYRRKFQAFLQTIKGHALARGCDWLLARTDRDPYLFLKECFLARDGGQTP